MVLEIKVLSLSDSSHSFLNYTHTNYTNFNTLTLYQLKNKVYALPNENITYLVECSKTFIMCSVKFMREHSEKKIIPVAPGKNPARVSPPFAE